MTHVERSGGEHQGHVQLVNNVLALTESGFEAFEAQANHTRESNRSSSLDQHLV